MKTSNPRRPNSGQKVNRAACYIFETIEIYEPKVKIPKSLHGRQIFPARSISTRCFFGYTQFTSSALLSLATGRYLQV